MAIISETEGTFAELMDDVADTALTFDSWAEVTGDLDNTGTDDLGDQTYDWRRNCRVLQHSGTGTYLTFYASNSDARSMDYNGRYGIRIIHSTDWDSGNDSPAGKTTVVSRDDMADLVGNYQDDSFNSYYESTDSDSRTGCGIWMYDSKPGEYTYPRNMPVTYFASVDDRGIRIGAWASSFSADGGRSACYQFEHVDQKFWDDGEVPAVENMHESGTSSDGTWNSYGFEHYSKRNREYSDSAIYGRDVFDSGDWGYINPDAEDDTFFFRRPVVYQTESGDYPVAYVRDCIPNHKTEGGAHGDIITHDGADYRIMRQSGSGTSTTISIGLRYE